MADAGHALRWTGYGSLASALDFEDAALRPSSPSPLVLSPRSMPKTPPGWASPYYAPSPSETASPLTPVSSFALYSPTAFYSSHLVPSTPPLWSNHVSSPSCASPSFRSATPPMPLASPFSPRSPAGLTGELPPTRPGPLVPQRAYKAPAPLATSQMQINFNLAGGVLGIPMRLLRDAGAMELPIEDAHSAPFPESVASTITLRIWWPGYLQYSRRMTMRKATGLLMRCELAMAVSEVYKEFIEEARQDAKDRGQSKWRVGRGHITVNDLVLLRMFQVSQGSWQADVRLEKER